MFAMRFLTTFDILLTLVKLWLNFEVEMPKPPFFTGFEAVFNFRSSPVSRFIKITQNADKYVNAP